MILLIRPHALNKLQHLALRAGLRFARRCARRYKQMMKKILLLLLISNSALSMVSYSPEIGKEYEGDIVTLIEEKSLSKVESRISLDINSDGINENAFGINCGNAGCKYYIYSPINKIKNKFIGSLFFHDKGIEINTNTNHIETYIRHNASQGCNISYKLGSTGFKEVGRKCN